MKKAGGKHAYLIMAHNQFDFLELLLKDIDDYDNDIYLHVDKKSKNFDEAYFETTVKKSRLHMIKRINVQWAGYSLVNCILSLLENATAMGTYTYYHLLVGSEFPIKSQKEIHSFFDEHQGYEFINYDNADTQYMERVKYYHPFNESGRKPGKIGAIEYIIRKTAVNVQRKLGIDLSRRAGWTFKKGNMNWSITDDLARYVVSQADKIRKFYRHTFCCDEVFMQTLVFNTPRFYDKVYNLGNTRQSTMRMCQWKEPKNLYHLSDIEELIDSECFFARKLCGEEGMMIAHKLIEHREQ